MPRHLISWWRHQMETFSALLAICAGNSPVPGEFLAQRPVTRSFDVYFDPSPNKRLGKQLWGWWFETQSRPLWRHRNVTLLTIMIMEWNMKKFWEIYIWSSTTINALETSLYTVLSNLDTDHVHYCMQCLLQTSRALKSHLRTSYELTANVTRED